MNLYRYTCSSIIITLSWFVPYIVCVGWLLFDKRYLEEWQVSWKVSCILFPALLILSLAISIFESRLRKRFPGGANAVRRRIILVLVSFVPAVSLVSFIFFFFDNIHFLDYRFNIVKYCLAIVATLVIALITAGLYEARYVHIQWISRQIETEQLKVKNLQTRTRLKGPVNPNFFFNCLDDLRTLIVEDQHKAIEFLDEMSRVYRHLSNNNRESFTTLLEELKFLQSYYHLLKARYGRSIRLQVDVADTSLNYTLPTLTLQLLVEKAIKYNVVLKEKPLLIQVRTTENNQLVISNNWQPRLLLATSNKMGFENIANKYQFPDNPGIRIKIADNKFSVAVPLVNKRS